MTTKHFKNLSSLGGIGTPMKSIAEDLALSDVEGGTESCPTQFRVNMLLKSNTFPRANEVAEQYWKYIIEEEYDRDTLLNDLRDEDGSWLVESELSPYFEWNDEETNQFKILLLQLIEEKQKEIKFKSQHKSFVASLLKKTQSKAFLGALQKTTEAVKNNINAEQQMPTYINRAIWFRSDDENLERLVDKAVKDILSIDSIWSDQEFIRNIYSDEKFNQCVEQIFKLKFRFFERFVTDRYKRELQLHALKNEKTELNQQHDDDDNDNDDDDDDDDKNSNKKEKESNYIVYYKEKKEDDLDTDTDDDDDDDNGGDADNEQSETKENKMDGGDDKIYEYHIFPSSMKDKIDDDNGYKKICKLYVYENNTSKDYEWTWWKRKTKGDLLRKAKLNAIQSYGFWELLNNDKNRKQNIEKNGVSVKHLNIIFELLRHYYAKSIKMKAVQDKVNRVSQSNKSLKVELAEMSSSYDPTILKVTYCEGEFIPIKLEADIYIHDDDDDEQDEDDLNGYHGDKDEKEDKENDGDAGNNITETKQTVGKSLYELTWWNGKKRADCNAIAIKNKTAMLDDEEIKSEAIKEKYYMRFRTFLEDEESGVIEWHWYDNDGARYQAFKDYVNFYNVGTEYKENLLHKQLEAIFQSNIDTNYPWPLFDTFDKKIPKNCHSFNNAQITHLRPALEENELFFQTIGYMARFVRLYASNDTESEFDLNIILSMEQVAITTEGTSFSRNIRRLKDGQNSLSFYYAGSNVFINHWLQRYLLSTKSQRLYFWSYILCIAAKIKQINVEVENQLVTIPQYKAFMSAKKADSLAFDEGEVRDEQHDAVLYTGFLVPPILDGETATDQAEGASSTQSTVRGLKKQVNNLSKTRILRKAKVKPQALKMKDEKQERFVWYQSLDGEQYRNSLGVMFRFAELIRKFILEIKHLGDDTSLWPYYKNYFHRNNHQSYHTLINRFNLSLMFNRSDMFELLEEENIIESKSKVGFFNHFSCARLKGEVLLKESERMKSTEYAVRHCRKLAAQLLLQKWDSLRNLNILRHQLGPLFHVIVERIIDDKKEKEKNDDDDDDGDEAVGDYDDDDDEKVDISSRTQQEIDQMLLIKEAKKYNLKKWEKEIARTNRRLQKNLNNTDSGWQLLTDYDIHRQDSIEITTQQFPFFESFMKYFVLNVINEEKKVRTEEMNYTEQSWYPQFKQSWCLTPEWWSNAHDIVLMELALKYADNWRKYGEELTGKKASDYMMRLRASDDNEYGTYIPGHSLHMSSKDVNSLFSTTKDELRPYLEFQHWCRQKSNILHRLKYVTNKAILKLNKIEPSLIEIRIPNKKDRPKFTSQSLIFSEYEKNKHLEYIERETKLIKVDNYTTEWTLQAMKTARGTKRAPERLRSMSTTSKKKKRGKKKQKQMVEHIQQISADLGDIARNYEKESSSSSIKKQVTFELTLNSPTNNQQQTSIINEHEADLPDEEYKQHLSIRSDRSRPPSYNKRQSVAISRLHADESESDSSNREFDEDYEDLSDEDAAEIRIHDPFIHRSLHDELSEVIHGFDLIKFGPYMARFIINEIREYNIKELWDALAIVMEAMPFPMGLLILKEQLPHLRRSKPERLFKVCKEMVDGTNFGVAAALRMAEYFEKVGKSDNFQGETWKEKSVEFEKMAHEYINDIESDHLLYILLTIPLYDTDEPMSILSLALEQKRVSFLNNDRILGIMKHVWYHSTAIHVEEDIDTRDLMWGETFQTLMFQPFKFYMSPVGFNWTIAILYLLYLCFVLLYSYFIVKESGHYVGDILLWLFNGGFVLYEISEWADKGRQYFSVTGIMNVWDIMISVIWVILFFLLILGQVSSVVVGGNEERLDIDNGSMNDDDLIFSTLSPNNISNQFNTTNVYPSTTSLIVLKTTEFFFSFSTTEQDINESVTNIDESVRPLYAILFAIQLFLLSTRFLTLFQNTMYLGSLLKIVQKMFVEILKFLCVAAVVVGAYTFGFYFIFGFITYGLEEGDEVADFWPTFLFTFDEFIAGGVGDHTANTIVPAFAIFITIFGFLILTNLLIALMTTEYENFQKTATKDVAYMWTETVYDLAHRDRLMPPPLNLIVYALGILIHLLVWPFAICFPTTGWNLYTRFNYTTYVWLDTFYCGCNKAVRKKINEARPGADDLVSPLNNKQSKKNAKIFAIQSKKIYADRFGTFLSFSGWIFIRDRIIKSIRKYCCPQCINDCCIITKKKQDQTAAVELIISAKKQCCYRPRKYCRRCCCTDKDDEASSLNAYHKGCYNCIKLRVKDKLADTDTTTIRGISMKTYIEIFEDKHKTKLHKEDKILLKHLTVDTLFCDTCYQPYIEKDVDHDLLSPFRVLLDYISCFVFLFTAWFPLVIFFAFITIIEYFKMRTSQGIQSNLETTDSNEYEEYDREYFPHPLNQIIQHN